jgi:hypothetical protein
MALRATLDACRPGSPGPCRLSEQGAGAAWSDGASSPGVVFSGRMGSARCAGLALRAPGRWRGREAPVFGVWLGRVPPPTGSRADGGCRRRPALARHNSYRVKKAGQHGTRHDAPPTVKLCNPILTRENTGIAALPKTS